ncbi:MAG: hypothetical protein JW846_08180 [Dehalococcoidia bacterium]|nr:hypothetical protein [Dehalococcoidia bacterium]
MTAREEVLDVIRRNEGHEKMLAVPRAFITLTGDTDSALLLSQVLYWTDRATGARGWVYKTRDEWNEELGLNRYRLEKARRCLKRIGLIEESYHLARNRRTLHIRLKRANLCAALGALHQAGTITVDSLAAFADDESPCRPERQLTHRERLIARHKARQSAESAPVEMPAEGRSSGRLCGAGAVEGAPYHVQKLVRPGIETSSENLSENRNGNCRDSGEKENQREDAGAHLPRIRSGTVTDGTPIVSATRLPSRITTIPHPCTGAT